MPRTSRRDPFQISQPYFCVTKRHPLLKRCLSNSSTMFISGGSSWTLVGKSYLANIFLYKSPQPLFNLLQLPPVAYREPSLDSVQQPLTADLIKPPNGIAESCILYCFGWFSHGIWLFMIRPGPGGANIHPGEKSITIPVNLASTVLFFFLIRRLVYNDFIYNVCFLRCSLYL